MKKNVRSLLLPTLLTLLTLQLGYAQTLTLTVSADGWSVEVLEVYSSDAYGRLKIYVRNGTLAYFTTVVRNNLNVDKNLALILELFDPASVRYGLIVPLQGLIPPGVQTITVSYGIPSNTILGNHTVTATAFTDLPENGGTPYSPGKSATFNVTSVVFLPGDINKDYKVDGRDIAIAAAAFATRPGDSLWDPRADINLDGRVDGRDIAIIAGNFGQYV